jgi:hypothetical protein
MRSLLFTAAAAVLSFYSARAQNMEFKKIFTGASYELASEVQETAGGYVIAGTLYPNSLDIGRTFLLKTNPCGDSLWMRTYPDNLLGGSTVNFSVKNTLDDGYLLCGLRGHMAASLGMAWNVQLIKTDADGNMLWDHVYGGADDDYGYFVEQTADSGFIVAGTTWSFGNGGSNDMYLFKVDKNGSLLWQKTFGGMNADQGSCVRQTHDGGYVIAYNSWSMGGQLLKTDASGNQQWVAAIPGGSHAVRQLADSSYVVSGTDFSTYYTDIGLAKVDKNGNNIWDHIYAMPGIQKMEYMDIAHDGGFVIAGNIATNQLCPWGLLTIKTDANGIIVFQDTLGGDTICNRAGSVQRTSDGGYILSGTQGWSAPGVDLMLVKFAGASPCKTSIDDLSSSITHIVYPNPVIPGGSIYFSVSGHAGEAECVIYDALGKKVIDNILMPQNGGDHTKYQLSSGQAAKGIYFYRLTVEGKMFSGRLLVQ